MRQVFSYMRELEKDPRVLTASLFMVHPFTSSDELGWPVHITTDGDRALAERLADDLADRAWAAAGEPLPEFFSIEDALTKAAHAHRIFKPRIPATRLQAIASTVPPLARVPAIAVRR